MSERPNQEAQAARIAIDGLLVRQGDMAGLEEYWVVVDQRGRLLGVRVDEAGALELAERLRSGVVPPVAKSPRRKLDAFSRLIRETLDEV